MLLRIITSLGLVLASVVSFNVSAGSHGSEGDSWKEEVLLHDGKIIVVNRSQNYGGEHEMGQPTPVNMASISFTLPSTNQVISWNETFARLDINSENLDLLGIDIVNGTPYLVTMAVGVLAANKWGCSNSRYVILKYDGQGWNQISIDELPLEIKEANVIVGAESNGPELNSHSGVITVSEVKKFNGDIRDSLRYLKEFERPPIGMPVSTECGKLEKIKGGWQTPGGPKLAYPITSPQPSGNK